MGEVYLAEDLRLGRKVALKILSRALIANQDRVRRFQQEARTISALNHPNILTVYDVGHVEDVHFIATEYVDGETLRERLATRQIDRGRSARHRGSDQPRAVGGTCRGHRPSRPETGERDGSARWLYEGARFRAGEASRQRQHAWRCVRHPHRGARRNDTRASSWARSNTCRPSRLGGGRWMGAAISFPSASRCTKCSPGRCRSVATRRPTLLARLIHDDPAAVSTIGPAPRALDPIVARLLRKLPEHRYQSADDLVSDLKAVAAGRRASPRKWRDSTAGQRADDARLNAPSSAKQAAERHPKRDQATSEAQRGFGRGAAARKSQS